MVNRELNDGLDFLIGQEKELKIEIAKLENEIEIKNSILKELKEKFREVNLERKSFTKVRFNQ